MLATPIALSQPFDTDQSVPAGVVQEIEVHGAHVVSMQAVLARIKTTEGEVFSQKVLGEDIKRLYATGYFTDVRMEAELISAGIVKVVIELEEKRALQEIRYEGYHLVKLKLLKEVVGLKVGDFLDMRQLREDVRRLERLYEDKGVPKTTVEPRIEDDEVTGSAILTFVVNEGSRQRVRSVEVSGNSEISTKKILKLMKTRRRRWWTFSSGVFQEVVFQEDLDRIQAYYEQQGYMDVRVTGNIVADQESGQLNLSVGIVEGKRYRVAGTEAEGVTVATVEEVLDVLHMREGEVFSRYALRQDISRIQSFYYDRGYINAQVRADTKLEPATSGIRVRYRIVEGGVVAVGKIHIQGNSKTKDVVIRRELRIHPGDRFDGSKIARSKQRLYNLDFFEEVAVDTQETSQADVHDLVITVKEAKTGELSFGAGFSSIDQLLGFVEVTQKNFDIGNPPTFTGDGQRLRFRVSAGTVRKDFLLSWTEPWFLDRPILFGFDLFNRTRVRSSTIGTGYDEERRGGALRLGKEFTEHLRGDVMYRFERVKISNVDPDASAALKAEAGKNNVSKLRPSLTYDTTDSRFNPTRGHVIATSLELAGGPIAGDKDYIKYAVSGSQYFQMFEKHVLMLKGRIGVVTPFGDSDDVPIFERFFAGGTNSVRGYRERRVGPVDTASNDPVGGEGVFVGTAEYTFPVIEILKGAVFADAGNVWEKLSDYGSDELKIGVGLGLRMKTPIGPVRIDWGYPVNPEEHNDDTGRVHFSLSRGF